MGYIKRMRDRRSSKSSQSSPAPTYTYESTGAGCQKERYDDSINDNLEDSLSKMREALYEMSVQLQSEKQLINQQKEAQLTRLSKLVGSTELLGKIKDSQIVMDSEALDLIIARIEALSSVSALSEGAL